MTTDAKQILDELKVIRMELEYIKEHMVDVDTVLTPEEEERLNESLSDFKEGKTTSLTEFELEMRKNVQSRTC